MSATSRALNYLRAGNRTVTLNCGYGRGYSAREVIEAVERNHGRKFPGELRRPPSRRHRGLGCRRKPHPAELDWIPEFESLDTIVRHALAWEHKLAAHDAAARRAAASA